MYRKILIIIISLLFITIIAACSTEKENTSNEALSQIDESHNSEDSKAEESHNSSISENSSYSANSLNSDTSTIESNSSNDISYTNTSSDESNISIEISYADTSSQIIDTSSNETSKPEESQIVAVDVPKVYINTFNIVSKEIYVGAIIKIYDPQEKFDEINEDEGSVKIRGNSTASGAKKPYNIKFSSKETVLGLGKAKKWCLLANMYDKTLIRNKIFYDFATEIGMKYVPNSAFVDVYVNDNYCGNYLLTEAVDTGKYGVDIDTDGNEFLFEFEPWEKYSNPEWIRTPLYGILLGFNEPEEPTTNQREFLNIFFTDAENALASQDLKNAEKYFDLPSMVDFYIVNEYFKNVDFSTSSTRFYLNEGKIHGGPIWDFDLSAGNCSSTYYLKYNNVDNFGDSTEGLYCKNLWYKYLFECKGFSDMVKERYLELQPFIINLTTDNNLDKNKIDKLLIQYGNSFDTNYQLAGWSMTTKYSDYERIPFSTYEKNISYLRQWLINRNEWLLKEWNLK